MAYFVFPLFLPSVFLFFFSPPPCPFSASGPREKRPPSCWDRMMVLLRAPSASSPHICAAFVLEQRRIWNGLLAASGRLMGNEVRGERERERGHGELVGIAKGIWMPRCGKQIKGCMWQKTHRIYKCRIDDKIASVQWKNLWDEHWLGSKLEIWKVWLLTMLLTFSCWEVCEVLLLFEARKASLAFSREYWCVFPTMYFSFPYFSDHFSYSVAFFFESMFHLWISFWEKKYIGQGPSGVLNVSFIQKFCPMPFFF